MSLYSIAVEIDDLRSDDVKKRYIQGLNHRLNAIKNLPAIVQAIGSERTRTELLPFLCGILSPIILEFTDDDDEVVISLAETLGKLTEYAGSGASLLALLKPLEILASAEEGVVREKAVDSLKKVLPLCKAKDQADEISKLILRLINNEETFASKLSALCIIPLVFKQMSPQDQQEMVK